MIIKVIEKCMHNNSKGKYTGTRTVIYESRDKASLVEALEDYEENFDSDNIIESNDSFNGGCLGSYVCGVTLAE